MSRYNYIDLILQIGYLQNQILSSSDLTADKSFDVKKEIDNNEYGNQSPHDR